jgi:hypothetical protein
MGGASYTFPSGPRYRHYVNQCDMVPLLGGKGLSPTATNGPNVETIRFTTVHAPHDLPPLSNGVSNYFARFVDRTTHGPENIYIPRFSS